MTGVILGASSKIGKRVLSFISESKKLNFSNLILQSNSREIEVPEQIKDIVNFVKCDFSKLNEIDNLLNVVPSNIHMLFNLVSIFEEAPLDAPNNQIEKIIKVNFLNQAILIRGLSSKLEGGSIIQFLDYCIFSPYTKTYFWYSISRMMMFDFYKGLSKYFCENEKKIKILILAPKIVETDKDFREILTEIERFIESGGGFVVKVI